MGEDSETEADWDVIPPEPKEENQPLERPQARDGGSRLNPKPSLLKPKTTEAPIKRVRLKTKTAAPQTLPTKNYLDTRAQEEKKKVRPVAKQTKYKFTKWKKWTKWKPQDSERVPRTPRVQPQYRSEREQKRARTEEVLKAAGKGIKNKTKPTFT